jgi:hypothetical protein
MTIAELYELRSKYEKELILAEAKVSVINDIIAKSEEIEDAVGTETPTEVEETSPIQSY